MANQTEINSIWMIYLLAFLGLSFGAYNIYCVLKVKAPPTKKRKGEGNETIENKSGDTQMLVQTDECQLLESQKEKLILINKKIAEGADVFIFKEYKYLLIFLSLFALLIFFTTEERMWTFYTTFAFITGALTSMACGFIGMKIATRANIKATYSAYDGLGTAFKTAYHGGCVMGFMLVSISLMVLTTLILFYQMIYLHDIPTMHEYRNLFECVAGYGLGASTVGLFCRVGGGIYTKAADVGADLVAKLEFGLEEDDPKNPATIADNVGDNVGDIAGMGADLFGSMAESLCAALLVAATSPDLINSGALLYPIVIIAFGVIVSLITVAVSFLFTNKITNYNRLEWAIKLQLIVSALLIVPVIVVISLTMMPATFSLGDPTSFLYREGVTGSSIMVCPIAGIICGTLIGISTEFFTSMTYSPVKGLVKACKSGSAINIILGLALGYLSNILPTIFISATVLTSYIIGGMYGIALSAIGMLTNLPICLAIDGYGPISDNAGGLASMCELDPKIREITDKLDSAGNTTAAIGKGFAIGSALLVALSLFGAFITRVGVGEISATDPLVLAGLMIGGMIPYLFSAVTMKAVGSAASLMVRAVREEFTAIQQNKKTEPDSNKCIEIATTSSLSHMFLPGFIVILTPIFFGVFLGVKCVSGVLIGIIISGIQLAISAANSGGAWDNVKKSIKSKPIN